MGFLPKRGSKAASLVATPLELTPSEPLLMGQIVRRQLEEIGRPVALKHQELIEAQRERGDRITLVSSSPSHVGERAIDEDVEMDELLREFVRSTWGKDALYYGEESPAEGSYDLRPGRIVVEVDAIDGSGPFKHFRDNFCTSITVFRVRRDGTLKVLAHLTVSPSWMISCSPAEEVVYIEIPGTFGFPAHCFELDRGPLPGSIKCGAVVGALPKHLPKIASLLSSPVRAEQDVSVATLGGNPMVPSLILDDLGWIYEPTPTKTWDMSALLALEMAGGRVYHLDGTERSILGEFEKLTDISTSARTLPGYIAVANPAMISTVLAMLGEPPRLDQGAAA